MMVAKTSAAAPAAEIPADDALPQRVARLAGIVGGERFPAADRASLKRWALGQPPPLAFYRMWLRDIDAELPSAAQTPSWVLITWGLAFGVSHQRDRPLGQALAESRFAEARLERLLGAAPDILPELIISAIRFLAAKGDSIDWLDAARLLLTQDAGKREVIHRRIAQSYFRHQPRNDQE